MENKFDTRAIVTVTDPEGNVLGSWPIHDERLLATDADHDTSNSMGAIAFNPDWYTRKHRNYLKDVQYKIALQLENIRRDDDAKNRLRPNP